MASPSRSYRTSWSRSHVGPMRSAPAWRRPPAHTGRRGADRIGPTCIRSELGTRAADSIELAGRKRWRRSTELDPVQSSDGLRSSNMCHCQVMPPDTEVVSSRLRGRDSTAIPVADAYKSLPGLHGTLQPDGGDDQQNLIPFSPAMGYEVPICAIARP